MNTGRRKILDGREDEREVTQMGGKVGDCVTQSRRLLNRKGETFASMAKLASIRSI
jgi:hypothetical protein